MGGLPHGSRILLVHSADEAYGSDRVLFTIASLLHQENCEVLVLLPDDVAPGWLSSRLSELGINVHRGPLGVARRRYFTKAALPKYISSIAHARRFLNEEIGNFDPAVVHVNSSGLIAAALLGRRRRWSLIWHVHEIIIHPHLLAWFFRKLPFSADQVVVVSEAVGKHLGDGKNPLNQVALVRNGIDSRYLRPKPMHPPIRVCFAGRLSEWKGYRNFLDVAVTLASTEADMQFIIAGDSLPGEKWREADIASKIERHELSHRISYVGFHDDIPALFDSAHIVVVPSILPDPLPTVVLEAMRSGCAVIATRHGGALEMVQENISGMLIPPDDSAALEEAILSLARDPELVVRMGHTGSIRIESEFTTEVFWRNMSVEFCKAIDLANQRRADSSKKQISRRTRRSNANERQL